MVDDETAQNMELNVTISVLVLLPVALALIAGGFVLYRSGTQAGRRTAGLGAVAFGVGVLVIFTLTLPVSRSGEGKTPEPVVVKSLVPNQPVEGATTAQEPNSPVSAGSMIPRPNTVEELVARSGVILLGTIEAVLDEKRIGPYGEDGVPVPADDDGMPVTDYEVQIDRVVKGDGTAAAGGTVVLRMFGHVSNPGAIITLNTFPLPSVGDYLLFALGKNPDGTYGSGPEGLLSVDGEKVAYADGVPFATEISPDRFVQQILDAAADPTD